MSNMVSMADSESQIMVFLAAAFNLSWQLAIVVLVPIFAGYKLDQHFNALPVFTVVGLVVAMFGTAAVLRRQLQLLGPPPKAKSSARRRP